MFSAKNYGLPKDLIEAAKRVHEKQLEEGAGKYAEPRMEPKIRNEKNPKVKKILHDLAATEKEEMNKKLPGAKKTQAEEVQFTEEELAEAFAIFLEENFHVDMLTEEDLDYVFENEFPQWLEEQTILTAKQFSEQSEEKRQREQAIRNRLSKLSPGEDALINIEKKKKTYAMTGGYQDVVKPPAGTASDKREKEYAMTGGYQDVVKPPAGTASDKRAQQDATAKAAVVRKPASTARNRVSAKPSISSRKQTGGPSLFQQAKKAVRPTPGDPGRTAINRLNYMARRGNKPSQQALKGPKKDWRASVFNPDGN